MAKLTAILKENDIKEITIVNMEVPCCFGLVQVVRQALEAVGQEPAGHHLHPGDRRAGPAAAEGQGKVRLPWNR